MVTRLTKQTTTPRAIMSARIVLAHDDPEFVHNTVPALRAAGYDVIAFADSMSGLTALEAAHRVEVLITRVLFPEGQPNGVSLGLMARLKRPGLKVLYVARPGYQEHTEGVGEVLAWARWLTVIAETVGKMLAA